jgi:hypothetical protein
MRHARRREYRDEAGGGAIGQLTVTSSEIIGEVIPLGNADESHSLAS